MSRGWPAGGAGRGRGTIPTMNARGTAPGSQSSLREANVALLVETVRRFGGITQVELAAATGLSPATVSTFVKDLLGSGVVETRNTVRSGRRAQLVTLKRRTGLIVGVQVAKRALRLRLSDVGYEVLAHQTLPLQNDHRPDTTLDRAALMITELLDESGSELSEVLSIGVGLPTPIDPASGVVRGRGVMRHWEGIDVGEVLRSRLGRPVHVENDANLGALGESRFGEARGVQNLIYVRASTGVGTGIMINGSLFRGRRGTAGEVGHALIDPKGPICQCGSRGCLNTVVGTEALMESLRVSHGPLAQRDIIAMALEGDPGCRRVVSDAGVTIGTVVANLAVAVNPEVIVVGGELARTGELLLAGVREAVERRTLLTGKDGLQVLTTELGDDAEVMGALALANDAAGTVR